MLSRDGLHLSFKGTETLVSRIEIDIKRIMSKPKHTTMQPLTTTNSEDAPRKSDVPAMIHTSSIQLEDKRAPSTKASTVNHINQQEETQASPSSANSEQLVEKTDVSKVNRTYSVMPEPTTQPTPTKDRYQKRRACKPNRVLSR